MFAYTLTTLTLCCTSILIASNISKRKGTLMEYMVFIMSFSMSIGLSIGFYLGILFKGELLYSTLLAILISGCIGFLVGLRFHLYTALEGMFSGVMASMMGAMITEMLNAQQAHSILFISLFIYYNDYYVIYNSNFIRKVFYCDPPMLFIIAFN